MTWDEALQAIAEAVDVSAFDEPLNVLREALSAAPTNTDDIQGELEEVKQALADKESAYTDLERLYRKRFGELIRAGIDGLKEQVEEVEAEDEKADMPIIFDNLALDEDDFDGSTD